MVPRRQVRRVLHSRAEVFLEWFVGQFGECGAVSAAPVSQAAGHLGQIPRRSKERAIMLGLHLFVRHGAIGSEKNPTFSR